MDITIDPNTPLIDVVRALAMIGLRLVYRDGRMMAVPNV